MLSLSISSCLASLPPSHKALSCWQLCLGWSSGRETTWHQDADRFLVATFGEVPSFVESDMPWQFDPDRDKTAQRKICNTNGSASAGLACHRSATILAGYFIPMGHERCNKNDKSDDQMLSAASLSVLMMMLLANNKTNAILRWSC